MKQEACRFRARLFLDAANRARAAGVWGEKMHVSCQSHAAYAVKWVWSTLFKYSESLELAELQQGLKKVIVDSRLFETPVISVTLNMNKF